MTSDEKKVFLLLKSVLYKNHGLDEAESRLMQETAQQLDAAPELEWTRQFMQEDTYTAFERVRQYLATHTAGWDNAARLEQLNRVWQSTGGKGYVSEMEATVMLKLAKDWNLQKELINLVRKK